MFSERRSFRSVVSLAAALCTLATLAATAEDTLSPAEVVDAFNAAIDRHLHMHIHYFKSPAFGAVPERRSYPTSSVSSAARRGKPINAPIICV